jgi:hypothetical protein
MLIAEDLLLLLTEDATGRPLVPAADLDIALGGAQLVELSMLGKADIDDRKRLRVLDAAAPDDELLARALAVVQRREGKRPASVLAEVGKKLRGELYARLTAAGILRAEHGKVLGIFPTHSWPTASAEHETVVRRALVDALVQGLTPAPRDAALVSLLHALRSTHKVVRPKEHGIGRRDLERQAKQIAEGSWGSQAVRQAIDEMTTAVSAGVMAATAASTTASS